MRAPYALAMALALAWPPAPGVAQSDQSWQITARSIQDTAVYDANGERVGELVDLLTERNGEIVAVLIGMGGVMGGALGTSERIVAAPYGSLIFMGSRDEAPGALARPSAVYLDGLTRADLEEGPSFTIDSQR